MASELDLLKLNRQELVEKILYVKPFLDRLLQHDEIVKEEYDNIVVEKTPQDRARALLDVVEAKGRGAFHHFREHLKKVNPELDEVLQRHCNSEVCTAYVYNSLEEECDVIRREFMDFKKENRKLLAERTEKSGDCYTETMQRQASDRAGALKATFCAMVDREYYWFLAQLNDGYLTQIPAQRLSSIADSESELESETMENTGFGEEESNPLFDEGSEEDNEIWSSLYYRCDDVHRMMKAQRRPRLEAIPGPSQPVKQPPKL